MNYTWTHTPDPATLRRDLVADQAALVASPTFAATCNATAAEFRAHARDWYELGDERRGDACTIRALAWEWAGQTGDLTEVRP